MQIHIARINIKLIDVFFRFVKIKFIELAVSVKAICIVSSDDDLLVLSPFRDITILTPDEFLNKTLTQS